MEGHVAAYVLEEVFLTAFLRVAVFMGFAFVDPVALEALFLATALFAAFCLRRAVWPLIR